MILQNKINDAMVMSIGTITIIMICNCQISQKKRAFCERLYLYF